MLQLFQTVEDLPGASLRKFFESKPKAEDNDLIRTTSRSTKPRKNTNTVAPKSTTSTPGATPAASRAASVNASQSRSTSRASRALSRGFYAF